MACSGSKSTLLAVASLLLVARLCDGLTAGPPIGGAFPNNNPSSFTDATGLKLALCTSPDACVLGGGEFFYYNMRVVVKPARGTGVTSILFLAALEVTDAPALFSRIRVRIVLNGRPPRQCQGQFRVEHPYGTTLVDTIRRGTVTDDRTLNPTGQTRSNVDVFVLPNTQRFTVGGVTYLANPLNSFPYAPGPAGRDFVRVTGPPGCNVDGRGSNILTEPTATFMGQVVAGK